MVAFASEGLLACAALALLGALVLVRAAALIAALVSNALVLLWVFHFTFGHDYLLLSLVVDEYTLPTSCDA